MFKRRKPQGFLEIIREWLWPKSGWKRATQYVFHRLIRLDDGPQAIAVGMACGAFSSASPLIGTHFITAAVLALIFRGNVIASTIGTWAGNPLSFPFIWLFTFQIGQVILGREVTDETPYPSFTMLWNAPDNLFDQLLYPMIIGAVPIGSFLALFTYFPSLWLVRGYKLAQKQRKKREKLKTDMDVT